MATEWTRVLEWLWLGCHTSAPRHVVVALARAARPQAGCSGTGASARLQGCGHETGWPAFVQRARAARVQAGTARVVTPHVVMACTVDTVDRLGMMGAHCLALVHALVRALVRAHGRAHGRGLGHPFHVGRGVHLAAAMDAVRSSGSLGVWQAIAAVVMVEMACLLLAELAESLPRACRALYIYSLH